MAVMTCISSLPIRKIGGIGKVTEHVLRDVLGINTCEEMLQKSAFICALFSSCSADFFLSVGLGLGNTDPPRARLQKSISCERTFPATTDEALIFQKMADIAESLAIDMAKEKLSGRTLTLKLKTESFEIRSRALTLGKSITSKEDILQHASKLLKAELPLSLRLIGLRMSHFGDEKFCYSDPAQKTLTDYMITGDALVKGASTSNLSASEVDDREIDQQSSLANVSQSKNWDPCDYGGLSASDHLLDVERHEEQRAKINSDAPGACTVCSNESEVTCTTEAVTCSSTKRSGAGSIEVANRVLDDEDTNLSGQKGRMFWIDDYTCSLCGFELPSSFTEERQHHSDFHLAEALQKEELRDDVVANSLSPSFVQKDKCTGKTSRKKQKPSPRVGKHLTIDSFFTKRNV